MDLSFGFEFEKKGILWASLDPNDLGLCMLDLGLVILPILMLELIGMSFELRFLIKM